MSSVAAQVHEYVTFRADREGVPHNLTVADYERVFKGGVRTFFGVDVSDAKLLRDTQNPALFHEWSWARAARN